MVRGRARVFDQPVAGIGREASGVAGTGSPASGYFVEWIQTTRAPGGGDRLIVGIGLLEVVMETAVADVSVQFAEDLVQSARIVPLQNLAHHPGSSGAPGICRNVALDTALLSERQ
mgnify:CR=1 FL=1